MVIGLALVVLALIFQGATGAALGVVGALTVVFGIVRTSLEGNVKVGPGGFEATFAKEVKIEIETQARAEHLAPDDVKFVTELLDIAALSLFNPGDHANAIEAARRVLNAAKRSPTSD